MAAAIRENPARVRVLGGDPGDTASGILDRFVSAVGAGGRVVYTPFAREALRAASGQVFGVASEPIFDLSGADLVIDFGSELLESGLSPVEHQRQWAEARDVAAHTDGGARLVYVGARLSLTASSADEWLPARPGSEGLLALALARAAIEAGAGGGAYADWLGGPLAKAGADAAAQATDVPAETIRRVGAALARAKAAVALPPGSAAASRRAVGASAAVLLLNQLVGAIGSRVIVPPADEGTLARASYKDLLALIREMQDGQVDVLLVHHANPVYAIPTATGFRRSARQGEARGQLRERRRRDLRARARGAARSRAARELGRRPAALRRARAGAADAAPALRHARLRRHAPRPRARRLARGGGAAPGRELPRAARGGVGGRRTSARRSRPAAASLRPCTRRRAST